MSLHIDHVSKSIRKGTSDLQILKDISLELPDTGIILLTGPNGCGKSTLLSLLGGLDDPSGGKIIYNGKDWTYLPERKKARIRSQDFGYVFADAELLPNETVKKNIALSLELQGKKENKEEMITLLSSLNIQDPKSFLLKKAKELSTGEAAKVSLARALIRKPKVLLFDEGLDGVDQQSRKMILPLLSSLSEKMLILMVSHYEEEILPIVKRHLSMDQGRIIKDESFDSENIGKVEKEDKEETGKGKLGFRHSFSPDSLSAVIW